MAGGSARQAEKPIDLTTKGRRVGVHIEGIVQGVGFRPHVSRLAREYGLGGWVRNDSRGVDIEVSGEAGAVGSFLADLADKAPPLACILRFEVTDRPYAPETDFRIAASDGQESRTTLICPDVCICPDCQNELSTPDDRRFRYPFINCTNCGPRYSIILDIPYDRDKTTMARFIMCDACRAEYEDPENRRYHAQPNACPKCGPQVWLEDPKGQVLARRDGAVREAISMLADGRILAVKGLGGFHLAALATDEAAMARLRTRKHRDEKPFAVMFADLETVKAYGEVGPEEGRRLMSLQRPIVILEGRDRPKWFGSGAVHGAREPDRRRVSAVHAAALSLVRRRAVQGPGHDQRQRQRIPHDQGQRRSQGPTERHRGLFPVPRPGHPGAVRRLGGAGRGWIDPAIPPGPGIRAGADPFVGRRPVRAGRGRGTQEHPVPDQRPEAFVSQHIGDLKNMETFGLFEEFIGHLKKSLRSNLP